MTTLLSSLPYAWLTCVGVTQGTTYRFSIPDEITSARVRDIVDFIRQFDSINVCEGTYQRVYRVDTTKEQRYIIDSPNIDSSTLRVYVKGASDVGLVESIQWLIIF